MENENQSQKKKWYKKWWVILIGTGLAVLLSPILLILSPIIFIWYMWAKTKWGKIKKIIITAAVSAAVLLIVNIGISGIGMPQFKDLPKNTTQQSITVKGFSANNAKVKVFLNDNLVSEIQANEVGDFEILITLNEGSNSLYAVASYSNNEKKSSVETIFYTDQAKIDAQKKVEADAKAAEEAKAVDAQAIADAANQKVEAAAKAVADADAANQKAADDAKAAQQKAADDAAKQPSDEDQLKQIVSDQLKGNNNQDKPYIRKIDVAWLEGSGTVSVEYNADENFTDNMTKQGIEMKMSDIYAALFTSGKDVERAAIAAYFPLQDKYGNTSDGIIYKSMLDKAEADKVNWKADKSELELNIVPKVWDTTFLNHTFQ